MKEIKPHTLKMFKRALLRIDDELMEAQFALNKGNYDKTMQMLVKNRIDIDTMVRIIELEEERVKKA